MSISPIPIAPDIFEHLELGRWNALPASQRREIGQILTESIQTQGYSLADPELRQYGPHEEQPILEWRDGTTGCAFVLIPGGTFAPGYDDEQLARYARLHQRIQGWNDRDPWNADAWSRLLDEEDEERGDDPPDYDPHDPPERTRIFASVAPCNLRRKAPISIRPFLMASVPLPAGTAGLPEVVTDPAWRRENREEMAAAHDALQLQWPHVAAVLEHYRWALPTSDDYEWALRGGVDGLFYWGDDLPEFVLNECAVPEAADAELNEAKRFPAVAFEDIMGLSVEPERVREWPYGNRFGLAGMVAWGHWCVPDPDPAADAPLIVRGGASQCYPWQMCGEWKSLLTASERRLRADSNYADWNALRPVLRLQGR